MPEDKISFILQIMQGVNELYSDTQSERKEAFLRLEQLRKKAQLLTMMRSWLLIGKKNMVDRVLIDTNVLVDYLLTRIPYYEAAKEVVLACTERKAKGVIAAHSITNMFFILRKDYTAEERREILINLCGIFEVEGIDRNKLLAGLQNSDFTDFEDCLQMECAKSYGAEYIVTRNLSDYKTSEVKAISPKDFLSLVSV